MSLRLVCLLFCCFICHSLFAQVGQTLYFKNFRPTDDSTHADYRRVMTAQNGDTFSYTEYYKDGSYITATGKNGLASPVKVGEERHFYKNGKQSIINRYANNGIWLSSTGFYPNGVLMYVQFNHSDFPFHTIEYDADSSGHVHIVNGSGRRQEPDSLFININKKEHYITEGPYKNGKKDGLWKGTAENGETFEEEYRGGKLLSGTTTVGNGKKYHYLQRFQNPDFGEKLDDFESRIPRLFKNESDTADLVFFKPGYLRLRYNINEEGRITKLQGMKKSDGSWVDIELRKPLPVIEPEKIRGVPLAVKIGNNTDAYTRNNFKGSPFQTDVYLNGTYNRPKY